MIFRPSLSRGRVAKGLTEEPSFLNIGDGNGEKMICMERDGDDVCINDDDDGDDDPDDLYDCYLKRLRVVGIQATPLLSDLDLKAG